MRVDWRNVIVGGMMGVFITGCAAAPKAGEAHDPDARAFAGTIISLRPMRSLMVISKEEHLGRDEFPNEVWVRYDANTRFLMDGQPTTLNKIEQYMTVKVSGHMRDGQMVAEIADFSSILPKNVRRAPTSAPAQ